MILRWTGYWRATPTNDDALHDVNVVQDSEQQASDGSSDCRDHEDLNVQETGSAASDVSVEDGRSE